MAFCNSITRHLSITILLLILISFSSIHAIDCGGKPFHCENTTHFKICVDFGNGVSSTVDDFVIPCPPGTECRGKNHFECEFLPATTTAAIALLSDVTNDTKVLDTSATTPLMWEAVTTNLPPGSPHDKEFSERYLNTEKPNDTEVIVTTNFPETVTGTTVDIVASMSENTTDEITNMTSEAPESLNTLIVNEQHIVTEFPVADIPLTGEAVNETVQEYQVTDVSLSETSTAMPEEFNTFMIIKATTSVSTTDETALVTESSVIIQNEENVNDTFQTEIKTSTPTLEKSTTAVYNGEEDIDNVTASNNPSTEASFYKIVEDQATLKNNSKSNEFIFVTTVTPAQLNSSVMDNIPEEFGTNELATSEIVETISNQEVSEIATNESFIDATTVAEPYFSTYLGADFGLEISTNAPVKAKPLQNVYVADESMNVTSTLNPVILNASKVDNFEAITPREPSILNIETKVAEFVSNQETTQNVVNIEGVFETTTPVQVITTSPSEFQNRQQTEAQLVKSFQTIDNEHYVITNDVVDNFTPEVTTAGEIIDTTLSETARDAVPVEADLSGVFDNILITTYSTDTTNKNLIKKGNEKNLDNTTQTEIPVTDVTTEFPEEVTYRAAASSEDHLSSAFDNKVITTERMRTTIKNPIKKSNEINVDITTEKQIPITDRTTEFLDIATYKDTVPVEAHTIGAFDNILITTLRTTAMIKNNIKLGIEIDLDITTETQIPISDMTTEYENIVTHTKSIFKDTAAEESIFTPDSSSFTKSFDSMATEATISTVSSVELRTLAEPNYKIVPLIKPLGKHNTPEKTVSGPDYSQTMFEGTGYQSDGINANEGWLIIKDVETTTDNIIIKEPKESFMTKSSVISKSERSTESSLHDKNNKGTPDLFDNLAVTLIDIGNEGNDNKIMPENKRFTVKAIQETKGAAATEKQDKNSWDPSDGLLMNMPNVVFELDKNTDSISSDFVTGADIGTQIYESSYMEPQYKKNTGHNDAFPTLSETIPDIVINQVPSSENVIETSQNFVERAKSAGILLANSTIDSITEALSQKANNEKDTTKIGFQPVTESVTVPVKETNVDFELNNNANLVMNQYMNASVSKTEENEESSPAKTSGVSSNVDFLFVSPSNGGKYISLDPLLDSSPFPETENQTQSQNAQNRNGVLSTYLQTTASDASTVPIKPAQTKRTTVATTTVTNNIKDLKTVGTEHLEHTVTSRTSSSQTYNAQETVNWGLTDQSTNIGVNKEQLTNNNNDQEQIRTMPITIQSTTPISSARTSGILNIASIMQRDKIENGSSNIHTDNRNDVHAILKNTTNTNSIISDLFTKITSNLPLNFEETSVNDTTLGTSYNTSTLESSPNETKEVVGEIKTNENMGMGQAIPKIPNDISLVTGLPNETYLIETVFDTKTLNVDKILIPEVTVIGEELKSPTQKIKDTPVQKEEEYTKNPSNLSKEVTIPFIAGTTILPHVQTTKIYESFTQSMTHMENTASTTHGSIINDNTNANGDVSKLFLVSTLMPPSFKSSYANTQATVKSPSSTETTIIDKSITPSSTVTTITKADKNINISAPVTTAAALGYDCSTVVRGRFSDKFDCRKFYICIDKHAIVGYCPGNAVFSPIKKQCTKNLAHCLRDGEFQCTSHGRFVDIQRKNIYYICVRNALAFVRFQFQCQDGFILNKSTVRCEKFIERHVTPSWLDVTDKQSYQSRDVSKKALEKKVAKQKTNESDASNKDSEQSSSDVSKKDKKNPKSNESPEPKEEVEEKRKSIKCTSVGKIPHPDDCRKYYVCYKNKNSELRRKRKKCDSDEVFDKSKNKCVDSESYECNLG